MSTETEPPTPAGEASAPPLRRPEDWPERLHAFLLARVDTPFDWVTHNCCLFAADWVHELTGRDPAAALRAQLTTQKKALKYLADHGGVEGLIAEHLLPHGWVEVERLFAQRGDLVTHHCEEAQGGLGLGICTGPVFAATGPQGLIYNPMSQALRAWHID